MMRGEREGLSVMDGTIVSSNSTLETVTHSEHTDKLLSTALVIIWK